MMSRRGTQCLLAFQSKTRIKWSTLRRIRGPRLRSGSQLYAGEIVMWRDRAAGAVRIAANLVLQCFDVDELVGLAAQLLSDHRRLRRH